MIYKIYYPIILFNQNQNIKNDFSKLVFLYTNNQPTKNNYHST